MALNVAPIAVLEIIKPLHMSRSAALLCKRMDGKMISFCRILHWERVNILVLFLLLNETVNFTF